MDYVHFVSLFYIHTIHTNQIGNAVQIDAIRNFLDLFLSLS